MRVCFVKVVLHCAVLYNSVIKIKLVGEMGERREYVNNFYDIIRDKHHKIEMITNYVTLFQGKKWIKNIFILMSLCHYSTDVGHRECQPSLLTVAG